RRRHSDHRDRGPLDDVAFQLFELQGDRAGAACSIRQAALDPARHHRDRDRARARRVRAVRHLCVVGAGDVALASAALAAGRDHRGAMSRRLAYLAEIGIPAYRLRRAPVAEAPRDAVETAVDAAAATPVDDTRAEPS